MKNFIGVIFLLSVDLLFLPILLCAEEDCVPEKSPSRRVKSYLLCKYDDAELPTHGTGNATVILYGLIPKMANFDESTGNLELHAIAYISWVDDRFAWDSQSFENTTKIYVPTWRTWLPDITLHSPGGNNMDVSSRNNDYCIVYYHDGTVTCVPLVAYTVRCRTDFTQWPYDRQNCTLAIGSWSYSSDEVTFKNLMAYHPPIHMDYFASHNEWRMVVSRVAYETREYHYDGNKTTSVLMIDFLLDRVHNQLRGIYVAPSAIMAIMTLTSLWLSPRAYERLALVCLNPIIHMLCIQNLHWILPHNGNTLPLILLFYMSSFLLTLFALLLTFSLRMIETMKNSPPKWISNLAASILRTKIGQLLLLNTLDPKASAVLLSDEDDDTGNLVSFDKKEPAWAHVSVFLGWISFTGVFVVYLIMYALFMPNSSMKAPLDAHDILNQLI